MPTQFPGSKPKKVTPVKTTVMLALSDSAGALMLERRPPSGIWGGLWSLPEISDVEELTQWLIDAGLEAVDAPHCAARFRHTFSHYHLDIDVQALEVAISDRIILESRERV